VRQDQNSCSCALTCLFLCSAELAAPMIIGEPPACVCRVFKTLKRTKKGIPREARGRTAAGRMRRAGMVPTILQGLQKEQILMEVNAKRLSNLRRRHLLKQTQVLQVRRQCRACVFSKKTNNSSIGWES
jgi:ribosomal protein L25 (general stress protein Ctc)